ncbi:uncharacterized protein LOC131207007 [Anopheles bellator]|uniref:uncharacterized protein LOC131207007 n=1 Tax=Anopheles bellator TaxID=139047 RepID=UPI0026475F98|nr:uncharacterized protein LOC131207007 [Anopheles bellator]
MDFIGNLLNEMSSAFNQETTIPKKEEISMDETLKWRALKNNQFASRTRQQPPAAAGAGSSGIANGQKLEPARSSSSAAIMSSAENSNDSGSRMVDGGGGGGRGSAPILEEETNSSLSLGPNGTSSTPDLVIAGSMEDDVDGIEIEIAKDISGEELQEALGFSQLVVEPMEMEAMDDLSQQSVGGRSTKTPVTKSEDEQEVEKQTAPQGEATLDGPPGVEQEQTVKKSSSGSPVSPVEEHSAATGVLLVPTKGETIAEEENVRMARPEHGKKLEQEQPMVDGPKSDVAAAAPAGEGDLCAGDEEVEPDDDDVVIIATSTDPTEVIVVVAEGSTKDEDEDDAVSGCENKTVPGLRPEEGTGDDRSSQRNAQPDVGPATDVAAAADDGGIVEQKYRPNGDEVANSAASSGQEQAEKEEVVEIKYSPTIGDCEDSKPEATHLTQDDGEEKRDGKTQKKEDQSSPEKEAERPQSAGRTTRSKKCVSTPPPQLAASVAPPSQRRSQRFVKESVGGGSGKVNGETSRASPVVVKEEDVHDEPPTTGTKKKTTSVDDVSKAPASSISSDSRLTRGSVDRGVPLKSDRSLRSKQQSVTAASGSVPRRASETAKASCPEDSTDVADVVDPEAEKATLNRRGRKRLSMEPSAGPVQAVPPVVDRAEPPAEPPQGGSRSVFPLDPGENDSGGKQPAPSVQPARRGRKRKSSIPVEVAMASETQRATERTSLPYKRAARQSRDGSEGILASALARRDKVDSQGRSSRPIKLSAKMLANEELRQGFEQHNNGRIIIAADTMSTSVVDEPPATEQQRDRATETNRKQSAVAATGGRSVDQYQQQQQQQQQRQREVGLPSRSSGNCSSSEDVTLVGVTMLVPAKGGSDGRDAPPGRRQLDVIVPSSSGNEATASNSVERPRAAGKHVDAISTPLVARRVPPSSGTKCPDMQTFLQEVRSMRLGTNRSPEENPKLNRRQMKRLGKLKEKHLLALGLQRKGHHHPQRNGDAKRSDSDLTVGGESEESSGSEADFVPSGKIGTVGKPNVTLRLRKPETLLENPAGAVRTSSLSSATLHPNATRTQPLAAASGKVNRQGNQQAHRSATAGVSRRSVVLPAAATTLAHGSNALSSKDKETEQLQRSLKRLGCEVTIIPPVRPGAGPVAASSTSGGSNSSSTRGTPPVSRSGTNVKRKPSSQPHSAASSSRSFYPKVPADIQMASVAANLEIVLDEGPEAIIGAAKVSSKPASKAGSRAASSTGLLCLCGHKSDLFVSRPVGNGYCTAIDDIDGQHIGCCNELTEEVVNMLRPSSAVSFQVLCNMHRKRLEDHGCCAVCGNFCTQGNFAMCKNVHLFHLQCAEKYVLTTPRNPNRPHDPPTPPLLVLKCPHCGRECPNGEIQVNVQLTPQPVLLPSRRNIVKPAKMSVSKASRSNSNGSGAAAANEDFRASVGSLVPNSVKSMLSTEAPRFNGGVSPVPAAPPAGTGSDRSESAASGVDGTKRKRSFTKQDFFRAITQNNDVDRISEIISSGFDIETRFSEIHGGNCLHLVAHFGTMTIAYMIISRASSPDYLNIVDNELRTAMMCALLGSKHEIIKLLLDCGADATVKGPDGMTVLHLAAKLGRHEAVRIILDCAKKRLTARALTNFVNGRDGGRWTPLAWAAENRHKETMQQLLELGADVNACDRENNTSLHWATWAGCTDTLYLLLNKSCDPNIQNVGGDTPLHIACRLGHASNCILLMSKGASLTVRNKANEQPMDAISNPDGECASILAANLKMRSLSKNMKETRILSCDISNGRERYPVQVVHTTSSNDRQQTVPAFKYIQRTVQVECSVQIDTNLRSMRVCSCLDDCASGTSDCICSERTWYTADGRLVSDFNYHDPPEIIECGDACDCNRLLCQNRVVQRGLLVPLQIFYSPGKAWSVRTLVRIPKGSFLVEYVGELLSDEAADRRPDDSYIFDLGRGFCIDASAYGNVSRFFNHSCKPNVSPVRVFYDHQDVRFPKVAMFACRDIEPQEEICFDYGDKFWMVKNRTLCCQCNATECRYQTVQQAPLLVL